MSLSGILKLGLLFGFIYIIDDMIDRDGHHTGATGMGARARVSFYNS